MVISGQTRWQTVVLKTTGLLALMAMSGISVPAKVSAFSFLYFGARGHRRPPIANGKSLDDYLSRCQQLRG
jgi:hypothetical protein